MTETGPPRLDHAMDERRIELRLKWRQVAERADLTAFHLQRIRAGKVKLSKDAAVAIDDSMEWERGSAWRVYYEDGEPEPLKLQQSPHAVPPNVPVPPSAWAILSPEERTDITRIFTGARRRQEQQRRSSL